MRRTASIGLLIICLALPGCTSGSDDGGGGDDKPAKPKAAPTADRGETFMTAVKDADLDSYTDGMPPTGQLKSFPKEWCNALEAGHSVAWILGDGGLYPLGDGWGTEKADAHQLILLATNTHCPQYTKRVREELRDSGGY